MTDAEVFIVLIIVVLGFLKGGEDMKKIRGEKEGAEQSKSLLDYIMLKDLMDK